jgi:putative membrane protein
MTDFPLLNAIIYAALGIVIFAVAFVVIDKMTPFHLWNEIVKEKNIAVAILMGAMSIGMCIIIAAAVH